LTTLYNKKNYVLHQRNLRQYLSKGLRVEKIHRVLKFNQSHWLKGYIDFNTQRRTESKTDFEKDFYKLMNNAVFGKTMENVRKRQNIRLSTSWKQASKLINRPSFTRAEVFTENFCAIHLIKESIEMNKPIYIGTTILDLSKSLMYDYFYNNLRKKYQNDVNLLYMDTDSFILKINTNDVYSDMKRDINIYDTSNYSPESELFSSKNKKVIGKFKDELGGNVMSEFVGLRPGVGLAVRVPAWDPRILGSNPANNIVADLNKKQNTQCSLKNSLNLSPGQTGPHTQTHSHGDVDGQG
uniref:uncharacterized protein n=1 Tax=Myxine glutinosa TaxID=7769 RepID=UPI00358FFFAA